MTTEPNDPANALVAYFEVETLDGRRSVKDCKAGHAGDIGDDISVRMPDESTGMLICEGPNVFSYQPHPNYTLHLVLIEDDGKRAKLGLTSAHLDILENIRPELHKKTVHLPSPS